MGNLSVNNKAALFLMDYPNRRRLKIFVDVEVSDASERPDLVEKLNIPSYDAKIERAIILKLNAFAWNCPQHITPRYTMNEVRAMVQPLNDHIEILEKKLASYALYQGKQNEKIS